MSYGKNAVKNTVKVRVKNTVKDFLRVKNTVKDFLRVKNTVKVEHSSKSEEERAAIFARFFLLLALTT